MFRPTIKLHCTARAAKWRFHPRAELPRGSDAVTDGRSFVINGVGRL